MADHRPYVDFKVIKARIGMADVLARYNVQLKRVNQMTLRGNCPLPSHASASKDTFYVNEAKNVWYCHSDSCKKNGKRAGGNVIDFVTVKEGLSVYDAAKWIDELFPATRDQPEKAALSMKNGAENATRVTDESDIVDVPVGNRPLTFTLKDVTPSHPMIQERGISVETARRFGVGFFPGKGSMAGRIVFPLYEVSRTNGDGTHQLMLVGYAGRTTLPVSEANPKWLFGKGLKKIFLYGLERCDPVKPVILCESLWGPLWFCEKGMQAASLMGSEMTPEQERCLDAYPVITVALDNDTAGIEKAAHICERLKKNHRVSKARLVE